MQLHPIDKARYSKQVKFIFIGICLFMIVVSLLSSTLLIHFIPAEDGDNFWRNVAGAITAVSAVAIIYQRMKSHAFLKDIVYVRQIKAQLNYIYRKQRKLLACAAQGDAVAMAILDFSYRASAYVFELDDNTLTLEELQTARSQLQQWTEQFEVEELVEYQHGLLANY